METVRLMSLNHQLSFYISETQQSSLNGGGMSKIRKPNDLVGKPVCESKIVRVSERHTALVRTFLRSLGLLFSEFDIPEIEKLNRMDFYYDLAAEPPRAPSCRLSTPGASAILGSRFLQLPKFDLQLPQYRLLPITFAKLEKYKHGLLGNVSHWDQRAEAQVCLVSSMCSHIVCMPGPL
jgi:hypothetical protein